jgi:hypothetical protein
VQGLTRNFTLAALFFVLRCYVLAKKGFMQQGTVFPWFFLPSL